LPFPLNNRINMTFFDNFSSAELIAAHRGYRGHFPENTLSAFVACIGHCHFLELDIQMSKDDVPMVFHDSTLERTSDAKIQRQQLGLRSLRVGEWTLSQLKQLDAGSWFLASDPFSTIANGTVASENIRRLLPQRIPTLEEVLLHPALNKIPINVEIKDHKGQPQHQHIAAAVIEVIRKTKAEERILISSFNHDYLTIVKSSAPKISVGVLQDGRHPDDLLDYLHALRASAYHPSDAIVDRATVKTLRSAGFGINVYTVNSAERQKQLFNMGVTAVFTDFPHLPSSAN
jgi:glycerophosphoryl diester phosphodiesterase